MIYLYQQNQLECIKNTPYENRICHIDATSSLVSVKNDNFKHSNYNRILNYFVFLKVIKKFYFTCFTLFSIFSILLGQK